MWTAELSTSSLFARGTTSEPMTWWAYRAFAQGSATVEEGAPRRDASARGAIGRGARALTRMALAGATFGVLARPNEAPHRRSVTCLLGLDPHPSEACRLNR